MREPTPLYSTELTVEERELGFELVELPAHPQRSSKSQEGVLAVVYRLSQTDQIAKMVIPVIGGHCYRHERLAEATGSNPNPVWLAVNSIVFPLAEQAVLSVGKRTQQLQCCG